MNRFYDELEMSTTLADLDTRFYDLEERFRQAKELDAQQKLDVCIKNFF